MKRREFLPGMLAAVVGTQLPFRAFGKETAISLPHPENPRFWEEIRAQFRTGTVINLNNGAVSPHPLSVEEAFFNYHRIANDVPSQQLRRFFEPLRLQLREKLSTLAGCLTEEIAVNRNATEALVTIIMGLPLKRGDEVVLSVFDYPSMMNAWKIREQRDGIRLRWVNPEAGGPDTGTTELIHTYISQFTAKTKVVHITHMINWTGRLLPAHEIVAAARAKGITTVVDAAHSFAHTPFSISEMGCDYLGVSLHKWLCAPFGTGMLYVKKGMAGQIPSLFPTEPELYESIKKFEELGTHNTAAEMGISEAIDFHNHIGGQRKYERLVELRNHWVDQVKTHPQLKIHTPLQAGASGAIALAEVKGKTAMECLSHLMNTYHIHVVAIHHQNVQGVRVTPHVYTSKEELDLLAKGLLELAG